MTRVRGALIHSQSVGLLFECSKEIAVQGLDREISFALQSN